MTIEAKSAAAVAAGSGAATVLSAVGEVTMQFLGVPLPVVLACGTGAWIARVYSPSARFFPAIAATMGWTIAGCVLVPLASAAAKRWLDFDIPNNGLAGLGLLVSLALPMLLPAAREWALSRLRGKGAQS
jgi:hypothetical protein